MSRTAAVSARVLLRSSEEKPCDTSEKHLEESSNSVIFAPQYLDMHLLNSLQTL